MQNGMTKNKSKLTREELLAGKCFVDEQLPADNDPRFKSPDLILDRNPTSLVKNAEPMDRIDKLEKALKDSWQQYNTEMEKWRAYEAQITTWKEQVMRVLQQLRDDIAQKNERIKELTKVKTPV